MLPVFWLLVLSRLPPRFQTNREQLLLRRGRLLGSRRSRERPPGAWPLMVVAHSMMFSTCPVCLTVRGWHCSRLSQEFKMSSKSLRRELKANKAQLRQMRGNHQPQEAGTVIGGAIMAGLASVEPGKQVAGRRQRPGADETAEERRRHHVLRLGFWM